MNGATDENTEVIAWYGRGVAVAQLLENELLTYPRTHCIDDLNTIDDGWRYSREVDASNVTRNPVTRRVEPGTSSEIATDVSRLTLAMAPREPPKGSG